MNLQDLHDLYHADCRRFARSLCRDHAEADDVVQEVLLRAQGHLPLLEILSGHERRSWLFRAIRNHLIDLRRREQRWDTAMQSYEEPMELPMEDTLEVQRRIGELPEPYPDILYRKYWLGMTSAQIGDDMQMPPSTVRHHLRQAHGILKKTLAKQW